MVFVRFSCVSIVMCSMCAHMCFYGVLRYSCVYRMVCLLLCTGFIWLYCASLAFSLSVVLWLFRCCSMDSLCLSCVICVYMVLHMLFYGFMVLLLFPLYMCHIVFTCLSNCYIVIRMWFSYGLQVLSRDILLFVVLLAVSLMRFC